MLSIASNETSQILPARSQAWSNSSSGDHTNALIALIGALASPGSFQILEKGGELFIVPVEAPTVALKA